MEKIRDFVAVAVDDIWRRTATEINNLQSETERVAMTVE
jgi:hypothetical protein